MSRPHPSPSRSVQRFVGLAIAAICFVLAVGVESTPPGSGLVIAVGADGSMSVASVERGSWADQLDIRAGDVVVALEPPDPSDWQAITIAQPDGLEVTLSRDIPAEPLPAHIYVMGALLAASIVMRRVGIGGASLVQVAVATGAALTIAGTANPLFDLGWAAALACAVLLRPSLKPRVRRQQLALVGVAAALAAAAFATGAIEPGGLALLALPAYAACLALDLRGRTRAEILDELLPVLRATRVKTIEEERTRLAFDLHTAVLPSVSHALNMAAEEGEPAELQEELSGALSGLRELIDERQSVVLQAAGLGAAIETIATQLERRSGLVVNAAIGHAPESDRPPADVELAAYRIAQAALENIERHAGADNVKVSLAASARAVALDISDDGVGLDPADAERAARGGHLGLVDMRRQAELVGALLEIEGRPGEGTRISFRWPG